MQDYRLKAIDSDKGIYRWYEIKQAPDLLGRWSLIISYGRIGRKGRSKVMSFDSLEEKDKFLQKTLRKRLTSERRIGCNYTLIKEDRISFLSSEGR
ncbi:WGR domain-containing protein [Candidatus Odyssella thessalonicensis]|uniref:WGR domain-containing protein n=1 Tax=Candidatus Odyssella thessalonicensis TaxID=84647 RepID=UPI000225B759|nr:WGR domain-containing protein [Candidatus Odyssella thessalonicensis]